MPFADELACQWVRLHPYDPAWADEAAGVARRLTDLVPAAVAVEHIGSTSIPEMPAKDCLDMMIVVGALGEAITTLLTAAGYRLRPEPWNRLEEAEGRSWPKLVFAPPAGERSINVHVRPSDSPTARRALLFRDFLRTSTVHAQRWAQFKTALANAQVDLPTYGQAKAPAWELLMELAEGWSQQRGWQPPWLARPL